MNKNILFLSVGTVCPCIWFFSFMHHKNGRTFFFGLKIGLWKRHRIPIMNMFNVYSTKTVKLKIRECGQHVKSCYHTKKILPYMSCHVIYGVITQSEEIDNTWYHPLIFMSSFSFFFNFLIQFIKFYFSIFYLCNNVYIKNKTCNLIKS